MQTHMHHDTQTHIERHLYNNCYLTHSRLAAVYILSFSFTFALLCYVSILLNVADGCC